MDDRSLIQRFLNECDEVAQYHPHSQRMVTLSRDILDAWRGLDASDWRAERWEDIGDLTAPDKTDEEFRHALEQALSVAEIRVVEAPPDYMQVTPV